MNRHALFAVIALISCTSARADMFFTMVFFECTEANDSLIVSYKGGWNEEGEKFFKEGANAYWPHNLFQRDEAGKITGDSIERECKLRGGVYRVRLGGIVAEDPLANGGCGDAENAWIEIYKGPKRILQRTQFEKDCHMSGPVVTEVAVKHGILKLQKVPSEKFYGY